MIGSVVLHVVLVLASVFVAAVGWTVATAERKP